MNEVYGFRQGCSLEDFSETAYFARRSDKQMIVSGSANRFGCDVIITKKGPSQPVDIGSLFGVEDIRAFEEKYFGGVQNA